jgi:protein gp37
MADVFEYRAELNPWREKLWRLIDATPNLDWLLITKRPQRIASSSPWGVDWPDNVWLGTTVENQSTANERIPSLLKNSAPVRFLSCEPLIGPVDLAPFISKGIDWVIAGGESGGKSRPSHPQWVRNLREQCQNAGISFLFKQWGNWSPAEPEVAFKPKQVHIFDDGATMVRANKAEAGRILDNRTWDQIPLGAYETAGAI